VPHDALEHRIRELAHRIWEQEGRPEGREGAHWREAERQVLLEEGAGEPVGAVPELPPGQRPEPQPEAPADPLSRP
jgi:hypothetical protein